MVFLGMPHVAYVANMHNANYLDILILFVSNEFKVNCEVVDITKGITITQFIFFW